MIFKPFVKVIYSLSLTQVALLLLAMYLLTYSGKFHGIDEIADHVTLESLWREQSLAVPQFQWAQDWTPTHVAIGDDGQLYSKRGLAYTLAFFPFWVIAQFTSACGRPNASKFKRYLTRNSTSSNRSSTDDFYSELLISYNKEIRDGYRITRILLRHHRLS